MSFVVQEKKVGKNSCFGVSWFSNAHWRPWILEVSQMGEIKKKMFNYNSFSFSFPIELHRTRSENRISQNVHEGKQYLCPIITKLAIYVYK